jgi:hypothetical protein
MKVQSFRQLYISLLLFFSFSLVLGHSFVPHHHHRGLAGMQADACRWEHSLESNALSRLLHALYSVNLGANHLNDFQANSLHYEWQQEQIENTSLLCTEAFRFSLLFLPVSLVAVCSTPQGIPLSALASAPPLRGPPHFS